MTEKSADIVDPLTHPAFETEFFSDDDRQFMHGFFKYHPQVGQNFVDFLTKITAAEAPVKASGRLERTPRTGWVRLNIPNPETVGQHMRQLSRMVKSPQVQAIFRESEKYDAASYNAIKPRLTKMAQLHDMCEVIVTDFTPDDPVLPDDKDRIELLAARVIYRAPAYVEQLKLAEEYIKQETEVSHLLNDFDRLHALVQAAAYERRFGKGDDEKIYNQFRPRLDEPGKIKTEIGHAFLDKFDRKRDAMVREANYIDNTTLGASRF